MPPPFTYKYLFYCINASVMLSAAWFSLYHVRLADMEPPADFKRSNFCGKRKN